MYVLLKASNAIVFGPFDFGVFWKRFMSTRCNDTYNVYTKQNLINIETFFKNISLFTFIYIYL